MIFKAVDDSRLRKRYIWGKSGQSSGNLLAIVIYVALNALIMRFLVNFSYFQVID